MLGTIGSVLGIATGINSLTGGALTNALGLTSPSSQVGGGTGAGAQAAADPFASYRAKLASMYSGALQPGASADPTKMPGYSQFQTGVIDPAMEASKRSAAASGQLYSGAESASLNKIGQQGYYGFMTDYLNRLAQGSGATQSPATAAGLGLTQGNLNNQAVMQGLGALTTGVAGLAGGSGGGVGGYINSTFGRDTIQADTGVAADTAAGYYGSGYDAAAGWSM